ncbi:MAG: recombination regulator RecX [Gammaproteobacteria bacterium]|nr:recombination regulator RecX [Gammaproteobacteria bacterium]
MTQSNESLELPRKQALALALRLLARREHSRFELAQKLRQRQFSEAVIDHALSVCEQEDWLSDARYAEAFIRQRLEAGYGELRIRSELHQHGVATTEAIRLMFEMADGYASALDVRCKRFGDEPAATEGERVRQWRYLQQRGFTGEQIRYAIAAEREDA